MVIGILIALQINNWNELRKKGIEETRLLQSMRQAMLDDIEQVEFYIRGNDMVKHSCEIILDAFDRDLPYHDSLAIHFEQANQWWKMILSTHAYERAKEHGLDFIKDDSIRVPLIFLYEGQLSYAETLDERQAMYYYQTVTPILTDLFESIDHHWYIAYKGNVPYDYESLKHNQTYRNILNTHIGNRDNYNGWMLFTLTRMNKLEKRLQKKISLARN